MSNAINYYMDYLVTNIALNHSFEIKFKDSNEYIGDTINPLLKSGKGEIEFKYLWKDMKQMSFENFCKSQSIPSLKHQKMISNYKYD